jgi:hypothetical protein
MARVTLNGKDLGIVWTTPWHLNITEAVQAKMMTSNRNNKPLAKYSIFFIKED